MGMIFLIRHGQASFGEENYDMLSETGILQSRMLGDYLADTGQEIDAVYSGKMERQKMTAHEAIKSYRKHGKDISDPVVVDNLGEYDFRGVLLSQVPDMLEEDPSLQKDLDLIYTDLKAFQRVFEGAMLRWVSGRYNKEGVETWEDFARRSVGAILGIISKQGRGKNIFVFTSGGIIAATMQRALGLSNEATMRINWQLINSSITRFMYRYDTITLAGFNCIPHLELKKDKTLLTYR